MPGSGNLRATSWAVLGGNNQQQARVQAPMLNDIIAAPPSWIGYNEPEGIGEAIVRALPVLNLKRGIHDGIRGAAGQELARFDIEVAPFGKAKLAGPNEHMG